MRITSFLFSCILIAILSSCSDQNGFFAEEGNRNQVLFYVDDFTDATQTRTNCDPTNNYKITWAEGDAIGIFPYEGDQEPFVIPASQIGQSKASFDGGYWALQGRRIKLRCPPKVLTGTLHPSLPSIFSG